MRLIRCFLALTLAAFANQAFAQTVKVLLPETGTEAALVFNHPNRFGDFRTFAIVSNKKRTTFTPRNPILRVPESAEAKQQRGIWTDIAGLKLDSSRFFLIGHYTTGARPHTLLFLLGQAGIGAAPVLVIGFSDDGQPIKVLESSALDVTSLETATDGAKIIGKTSLSEVMGGDGGNGSKKPYATTYDPFYVYVVHPPSPATYSLEASRSYNQKHYVWAGPHFRDDYGVLYNIPGHAKPFGAPGSKVDSLLGLTGGK
jgi:hypothetical protein